MNLWAIDSLLWIWTELVYPCTPVMQLEHHNPILNHSANGLWHTRFDWLYVYRVRNRFYHRESYNISLEILSYPVSQLEGAGCATWLPKTWMYHMALEILHGHQPYFCRPDLYLSLLSQLFMVLTQYPEQMGRGEWLGRTVILFLQFGILCGIWCIKLFNGVQIACTWWDDESQQRFHSFTKLWRKFPCWVKLHSQSAQSICLQ